MTEPKSKTPWTNRHRMMELANQVMTPTPETDSRAFDPIYREGVIWFDKSGNTAVEVEFARKLERERDTLKYENEVLKSNIEVGAQQEEYLKLEVSSSLAKLEIAETALKCAAREIIEVNSEKEQLIAKLEGWNYWAKRFFSNYKDMPPIVLGLIDSE